MLFCFGMKFGLKGILLLARLVLVCYVESVYLFSVRVVAERSRVPDSSSGVVSSMQSVVGSNPGRWTCAPEQGT